MVIGHLCSQASIVGVAWQPPLFSAGLSALNTDGFISIGPLVNQSFRNKTCKLRDFQYLTR